MKKPIRDFVDYYINGGKCIKDIIKETKELQKFKDRIIAHEKAQELTPEDLRDIITAGNNDNDC